MDISFRKSLGIFTLVLFFIFSIQIADSKKIGKSFLLEISFLDVGQGDSILINYLNHHQILIDGGPDGKALMSELGKVMPKNDKIIEVVILTHPDWDHFGGLTNLLDYYSVESFLTSEIENEKESFKKLVNKIQEKNIPISLPENGSRIDIGEYLDIEFLAPDVDSNFKDGNDNSIVARLDFGENSFLFTGDIGEKPELFLTKKYGNLLNVDWLKVAHHGSKNSSAETFLGKTTPKFAVISAGKDNRYGHPAPEALDRLSKTNAEIFRTDKQGTIFVGCETPKEESCKVR